MSSLSDRTMTEPVAWGPGCLAWSFMSGPDLTVKSERMMPPASEELHVHDRARQFFFVLAGHARLTFGGRAVELVEQQGLEVPPGTPHRIEAVGSATLDFLVVSAPAADNDRRSA